MNNTINGRTPEDIKRGLECCSQNTYTCGEGCPYEIECQKMGRSNDVILDTLAYIQQLERERDEARRDADKLKHAAKEATDNYFVMLRERDAAVEILHDFKMCAGCDHKGCADCRWFDDMTMKNKDLRDNWQWRGAQEVE